MLRSIAVLSGFGYDQLRVLLQKRVIFYVSPVNSIAKVVGSIVSSRKKHQSPYYCPCNQTDPRSNCPQQRRLG